MNAKRKILIVDDEVYIRELVATTLNVADYEILEAKDGEEALKIALEEIPDIILLDVMMPKIDGYEVCEKLKSNPKTESIIIIMLTAMGQEAEQEKGFEIGVDYYFIKPFSPMALLDKVRDVLGE
ncbi:MAG: response regulator transcription factor [Thermodesulfobacteriota bacterium]